MTYGVKLPDGRIIGFDEAVPLEQAQLIVRRDFPDAFKKKEGLGAEFSEGLASLIGSSKAALTAPFAPKEAAKRALLEEQARGAEFESGVGLDKLKKAYEERGLLGGAGELIRQAPLAVSGMTPQIMASLGSAATGARIGSVAGLPGVIGGALGGFGASLLPIAGQNIVRQAQEQEAAGKEIDPNLVKAYGAAAPAAALEVGSLGFTLGKRLVGKVLGQSEKELAEGLAKNAAKYEADLVKNAQASLAPTLGRGAARGLVEIPTEVAQQILERSQAGLDLFSPDALKEYGEAAYQAGLVGPSVGALAAPVSRAQARSELADVTEKRRAEEFAAKTAEEEAYKATPEYVNELVAKRDQLQEEMTVLDGILKGKAQTDEERQLKREAASERKNLRLELDQITESLREIAPTTPGLPPTLAQRKEQERLQKQTKAIAETADLVTDEFGNVIPGLTKSGAVAGRELTLKQKAEADKAMLDLKKLQEKEAKRQLNAQEKERKARLIEITEGLDLPTLDLMAQAETAKPIPPLKAQEDYDAALKELQEAIAASGQIVPGRAYTSTEESRDLIQTLQEKVKDKDAARKAAANEALDAEGIARYARALQDISDNETDRADEINTQKLVDLFTKEAPSEAPLTAEQKEAEKQRVEKLQYYKKNFYDSAARVNQLIAEAESRVKGKEYEEGKRGVELYSKEKEGRSLEVLEKGKELQAALEAQDKAKRELFTFLNRPAGGVLSPSEASDVLQDVAVLELTDTIDTMRKGQWFGGPNEKMAGSPIKVLADRARKQLDRYVNNVINAIEVERYKKRMSPLSDKSKEEIKDTFFDLFGNKIARATGAKAKAIKGKENYAIARALDEAGFKLPESIEAEQEIKTGFSREEFADVKDFAKNIQDKYVAKEREFGKLTREATKDLFTEGRIKDTGKVSKEEDVDSLLAKALDANLTADQRVVFEKAERLLEEGRRTRDTEDVTATGVKKVMPGLVDAVTEQSSRVLKGLEPDLRDINEAISRIQTALATPVQEQPSKKPATQLEFFPGQTAEIRATKENFSRFVQRQKVKSSLDVTAARKFVEELKRGRPSVMEFGRLFKSKEIWTLLDEATKLEQQAAKLLRKGKNKYRAEANVAFDLADDYRKEAYKLYADAEKSILAKLEKIDKPKEMLAQIEKIKDTVEADIKKTVAEQKEKTKAYPEYPERIKLLRLQKKAIDTAATSVKERVAKEEAAAQRQTGLGLPGVKSEFEVRPKISAEQPHRFNKVQAAFNFAKQYYKEMLSRRSMTMNKTQLQAYKEAKQKYVQSRENLNNALKENNVNKRIRLLMNFMVEEPVGTKRYKKAENLILGIEEQLEKKVIGLRPTRVTKKIEGKQTFAPDAEIDKLLGYLPDKDTTPEDFVGRISERELAAIRAEKNARFEFVKNRLATQKAPVAERGSLAKELAALQKEIKALDEVLNARRLGMIIGQAQEPKGVKRYKQTETEKKMGKAGVFEKAGVAPEQYELVSKVVAKERQAYAEEVKESEEFKKTPEYIRKIISQIAAREELLERPAFEGAILPREEIVKDEKTNKKVKRVVSVEEQRSEIKKEIESLKKDLASAMAKQRITAAFEDVTRTMFRDKSGKSGGIDMDVADNFVKRIKLPPGVTFVYVKNIADAPAQFIDDAVAAGKKLSGVRGGVLPDGTVVVIGDSHTDLNDLQETIEHELVGHYAVDTLLGPTGMKALVNKVFAGGEENVLKLATELGVYDDVTEAFIAAKSTNMSEQDMRMLVTREMVAHAAERPLPSKASAALKDFIKMIVNAVRKFFTGAGFDNMPSKTTQEIFNLIREAKKQYEGGRLGAYRTPDGNTAFLAPTSYSKEVDQKSIDVVNKLFAQKKTVKDDIVSNVLGLPGYTQFIDRLAPATKIIEKAESAGMIDSVSALQTTMYLRQTDQRLNLTAQAATDGVPQLTKNAAGEMEVLGKKDGANLIKVGEILGKVKTLGNPQAVNNLFGLYLVAKRAKRVGLKKLATDLRVTQSELNGVVDNINRAGATPVFEQAAKVYAEYNKDLINFAAQTGAISKQLGAELTKYNDYVPFYRVRDGIAQLVISGEQVINVGRLTDQPYLHELVGGKEMLVNFEESAFQNTAVLVDLALRNLATGQLAQQLEKIGTGQTKIATRVSPKLTGTDIIRAKIDGMDAAWRLNTKDTPFEDIPADLLIKGLDGIKLQIPVAVKLLGLPSRWLRTMITRDPAYSVRQIIKDSTAMWLYSGANAKPIIDATKELGSMWANKNEVEKELQRAGLVGGQLFTGMPEDMSKIMLQITSGKTGWQTLLAKLDRAAMKGDAATRVAMYNAYLKQGMTPLRAKLAVLESLNVNKRGLSPSVYWMSTLVPFMNTQVQGLTMFAKSFSGKSNLGGQKDLRMKMFKRGTYLALFTLMYAATMQDDEAYKNADPFVKYNSWFIRVPFLDEPIRVPTPFEFGYVFKGLPEAVFNLMFNDEEAKNVIKFFKQAAANSNPIGIPQAIKPAIEATANFSFFTGQNIESAKEKSMLPGYRERPQTTEFSKMVASLDKELLSPVMLDYLAKAYGGGLTLALTSILNPVLAPTTDVAAPTKMPSQFPIVGGFFQPNDANGVINAAYETAERAQQASRTLNQIAAKGNKEEIEAFVRKYSNELMIEQAAGAFTREMGQLAAAEKAVREDKRMSADEKAEKIKQLRAIRIKMAEALNKSKPS